MPNCKSFLVTGVERKHVRRRARFQQQRNLSCHQGFFFSARQGAEGNSRHSDRNIRVACTTVSHRQKLGGPVIFPPVMRLVLDEIIDQIHELILEDRRISATSIAEQLGISRERVESIIHEDLDMRKLSVKWVPK